MADAPELAGTGWFQRWLNRIERIGNALPQPATLFALLALATLLLSGVFAALDVAVTNPATRQPIEAVSLLTIEGLQRIIAHLLPNFIAFPPLGVVLVCLLGIAVAEHTGLISAVVRLLVLSAPRKFVTPMVVFAGVMSNAGGDVGYVLLIPLAAAIFHALGRHPLAGFAAAFAGVSGGFSANLLVGTLDVLLAGLTQSAAQIIDADYQVTGLANYYFMFVATFIVMLAGTWVTHRFVEPRLGRYGGDVVPDRLVPLSAAERRGMLAALAFAVVFAVVVLAGVGPDGGFLRDPRYPGNVLRSYFIAHLVPFIFVAGLGLGISYGLGAGTIRSDRDVVRGMEKSMASLGSYLVLAFFAAQFIAFFNWTNLGVITAVKGAELITALNLQSQPIPLMIALVIFSAAINLLIGSASAKWALLAPVFVPMFMLLGYSPELVQAAYRVGDSCTNIITPLMSYFPLIITFARKYEPHAGIGTIVATMLPYSIVFLVLWSALLILWISLGLPVGINAPLYLKN
ncbi:MAG TPA: AbgT family transporter [Candidatus Synoicihabitans sp.]|nr:AbgT family transporter [Candidatus Synoicihabitans sp.]